MLSLVLAQSSLQLSSRFWQAVSHLLVAFCCNLSNNPQKCHSSYVADQLCWATVRPADQCTPAGDQKSLGLSSLQLLQEYSPQAAGMLAMLVPLIEKIGYLPSQRTPDTLMGFAYTPEVAMALIFSASCALMVVLSGFLVIGSTSALTYNIIGHTKSVLVLAGGALMFGDKMTYQKLSGVGVALAGMVWYTCGKISSSPDEKPSKPAMAAAPRKTPESPTSTAVSPMKPPARQHLNSTD